MKGKAGIIRNVVRSDGPPECVMSPTLMSKVEVNGVATDALNLQQRSCRWTLPWTFWLPKDPCRNVDGCNAKEVRNPRVFSGGESLDLIAQLPV